MLRLAILSIFALAVSAQNTPILSQSEIEQLEIQVAQGEGSQKVLGQNYAFVLLGVTALDKYGSAAGVDAAKASGPFARHVREALDASTQAGVLGEAGEALWNYSFDVETFIVLHAKGTEIATQAAKALGVGCLDRAIDLDPENQTWRGYRIPIVILRSNFSDLLPLSYADAYVVVKGDAAVLTGTNRLNSIANVGKLAVRAEALDDAEALGREMLAGTKGVEGNWNYGNLLYFGNMVLGQVAVRRGDLAAAQDFLLASGGTPGSPQLNSFGPNMLLARDLLQANGDTAVVLQFFELCRNFWSLDRGRLSQWSEIVKAGRMPDFGANLVY